MKVSSLLFGALLAVTSVEAAATPIADASPSALLEFCNRSAQPCSKLKRAAEAIAEADPKLGFHRHPCYRNGQPCERRKRALDSLKAIFAEPEETLDKRDPEADPKLGFHRHPCYRNGQPCIKAKRALDNLAAVVRDIDDSTKAENL